MKEIEVIETEHGTFTENTVTGRTAEEVYQEWLANKNKQIDNCLTPTIEERTTQLEADKVTLAENVYMLAEIIEGLLGGETNGQTTTITEDTTD